MDILTIDTEFSAFYSPNTAKSGDLLQLSCIPVIDGNLEKRLAYNEFMRPLGNVWNKYAEDVHKITRARALNFQHPLEAHQKFMEWLKQFDNVFTPMGYNCTGDKNYFHRFVTEGKGSIEFYQKVKTDWIDVYKLAIKRKKMITKEKLNLGSVCDFFKIAIKAHDGLSDAEACYLVYECLKAFDDPRDGVQKALAGKMTEVEKLIKYNDIKYFQPNHDGSVYLTEYATKDKDTLRVVLGLVWDMYGEKL